jgi:UDP-N-acetylmuramyl pentapeptide phosphotransferase/UDP-N-acetylglucosamine-1-phosphate transferase
LKIFPLVAIFLGIGLISYVGVLGLRKWIVRKQILDIPNQRSSHTIPTPRGGGLVIVIMVLVTILVLTIINKNWVQGIALLVGGSLIAQVGWWDDRHSLSAPIRLLLQSFAAIAILVGIGYFHEITFPVLGTLHLGLVGIPVTFIWIVGLTNAFNFMDGIDGIAGGVALAGGLGWMVLNLLIGYGFSYYPIWISLVIGAANLGFLIHNWAPARIFMGDVASTFLGFFFSVLPLLATNLQGKAATVGAVFMWTFLLDTLITLIIRTIRHEKVLSAHRSHFYQRLTLTGSQPYAVSLLYISLTIIAGVFTIGWIQNYPFFDYFILIGLPAIWIALCILVLAREKRKLGSRPAQV